MQLLKSGTHQHASKNIRTFFKSIIKLEQYEKRVKTYRQPMKKKSSLRQLIDCILLLFSYVFCCPCHNLVSIASSSRQCINKLHRQFVLFCLCKFVALMRGKKQSKFPAFGKAASFIIYPQRPVHAQKHQDKL